MTQTLNQAASPYEAEAANSAASEKQAAGAGQTSAPMTLEAGEYLRWLEPPEPPEFIATRDALETERYRVNKLTEDLAEMAELYADSRDAAGRAPASMVPLQLLRLMNEISEGTTTTDHITRAALQVLPNSSDSDEPEAVLDGALALNLAQSNRVWKMAGLLVRYMQEQAHASAGTAKRGVL